MNSEERKAAEMTIVTMRREGCETVAQDIDAAMCKLFPSYPAPAPEPLPCPWCGAKPKPAEMHGDWSIWHVEGCYFAEVYGQGSYIEAEHIEGYNRRVLCPTCEGNEVRSATFRAARDNAEARAGAAEAKVAELRNALHNIATLPQTGSECQDCHAMQCSADMALEGTVAGLRSQTPRDDGERAAKLQARVDKALNVLRTGETNMTNSGKWVVVLAMKKWESAIRELEGRDHA